MKSHSLTKYKCGICSVYRKKCVIIHKTRRYTHSVCQECSTKLFLPSIRDAENMMSQRINFSPSFLKTTCPVCNISVDILSIDLKNPSLFRISRYLETF